MTPGLLDESIAVSLIYGASIYFSAWLFSGFLLRRKRVYEVLTPVGNRYGSIDGLRGVLAIGVLVHHSSAAYGYFKGGGVAVWS